MKFNTKFCYGQSISESTKLAIEEFIQDKLKVSKIKLEEGKPIPEKTLTIDSWYTYTLDPIVFMQTFEGIRLELDGLMPKFNMDVSEQFMATVNLLQSLTAKVEKLQDNFNKEQLFNAKCEVHVPGLGLLTIDEVTYEDDFCTEKLQDMLDKGWRILAVCPQPDQRRPDYILGKNSNKHGSY